MVRKEKSVRIHDFLAHFYKIKKKSFKKVNKNFYYVMEMYPHKSDLLDVFF